MWKIDVTYSIGILGCETTCVLLKDSVHPRTFRNPYVVRLMDTR